MSDDKFRCICDPAVMFEPPNRTPVAVEGCPAHRARRSFQLWARENEPETTFGWRCVDHPEPAKCAEAATCRIRPVDVTGTDQTPGSAWVCGPECPKEA